MTEGSRIHKHFYSFFEGNNSEDCDEDAEIMDNSIARCINMMEEEGSNNEDILEHLSESNADIDDKDPDLPHLLHNAYPDNQKSRQFNRMHYSDQDSPVSDSNNTIADNNSDHDYYLCVFQVIDRDECHGAGAQEMKSLQLSGGITMINDLVPLYQYADDEVSEIISNFDDEDESILLKLQTYFNATFSTAKTRKGFGTILDQPSGSPPLSV